MLQVTQNYRTGMVEVLDVPPPGLRPGGVVVQLAASLISAGTERGKVELARKSLLNKARARPEALRQVMDTLRREGAAATYRRVMHRLDRLTPLGYSAAGTVAEVGAGVSGIRVGDRVAVGGAGYANHAELVWVPQNLVSPLPGSVSFEAASFSTVAAVGLHAFRLSGVGLGDTVAVIGLGLIGQLAVQIAGAAGCRVVGCDPLEERVHLAEAAGASCAGRATFAELVQAASSGRGADAVLLTASSSSASPLRLAADVARDRATVVAVGTVVLEVPRDVFYRKELSLVVSRSYGPGRYDAAYEEKGVDYPAAYVRWTEGRNLAAVLAMMASRALDVSGLISGRYAIADAVRAYEALLQGKPAPLGIVLDYPQPASLLPAPAPAPPVARSQPPSKPRDVVAVGLVGAGSFASNVLVPALRRTGWIRLESVASAAGLSAQTAVRKLGFKRPVRDAHDVIADPAVDLVVIATPHHLHAPFAIAALASGKAVFVEKPLAISWEQLHAVRAGAVAGAPLMVGFNRRFSPHVQRIVEAARGRRGALMCHIRVNGGPLPSGSWLNDPEIGGGRLVGEGCHFIDLACYLVGAPPRTVRCVGLGDADGGARLEDNFAATLEFPDGSVAAVLYTAKGDVASGKERVEVFCDGWTATVDNFNHSTLTRDGRTVRWRARGAKGHPEEAAALVGALRAGAGMPIPLVDILASSAATLAARDSMGRSGEPVPVVV